MPESPSSPAVHEAVARPIRFVHRGAIVDVVDAPTTQSVLYWLREATHRVGTKEGCNEGDCGACMVIVASRDDDAPDGVSLQPTNACIAFVASLDGRALITVEDLKRPDGTLHPAQAAMVRCHGSQCGFCTPGFTMSLAACHDDHAAAGTRPTRPDIADALSGNLCRCTGYRPILDAGEAMFDDAVARIDRASLRPLLDRLADDPPLVYRGVESAQSAADVAWIEAPRTIDALAARYAAEPDACLVAGATDVGLWVTKQFRPLPKTIRIDAVDALKAIVRRRDDDGRDLLSIGAGASLEAAWTAIVALVPALREMQLRFASLPLRRTGTMGGNVANGSPIGDSAPALLALDATLVLRCGSARRRLPLSAFYVGYLRNRLAAGEFLEAIDVPVPRPTTRIRGYKLSKRYDCDVSAVSAGFAVDVEDGIVVGARFAFGGMDAVCRRSGPAEAAVVGRPWAEAAINEAIAALSADFTPLTDLRASASYRGRAAGNLLRRFWLETRDDAPLGAPAVSVWRERVPTPG